MASGRRPGDFWPRPGSGFRPPGATNRSSDEEMPGYAQVIFDDIDDSTDEEAGEAGEALDDVPAGGAFRRPAAAVAKARSKPAAKVRADGKSKAKAKSSPSAGAPKAKPKATSKGKAKAKTRVMRRPAAPGADDLLKEIEEDARIAEATMVRMPVEEAPPRPSVGCSKCRWKGCSKCRGR